MRSSPMSHGTSLHTVTRLTRRTPLRSRPKDPVTPATRRLMWTRSGGRCEIGMTEACQRRQGRLAGIRWDYSHRIRRAEGFHGPDNGLVACRLCHSWLHLHAPRRQAEECGWLLPFATEYPHLQPVLIGGRWWLLGEDGGRTEVDAA
jgi:hypothetical protein